MRNEVIIKSVSQLVLTINQLPEEERTAIVFQVDNELKNIRMGNNDKIEGFMYTTNDLTQFNDVVGNRMVNENSVYVRKLADSIQKIGNVSPIIINEKKEVIDGQRRIAAVRKYGLASAIHYIIQPGTTIETVGDINHLQVKWNHKDWLHKYTALDKKDYKQYEQIADEYESYMRSRSLRGLLMNGRVDPLKTEVWETGSFVINKERLPKVVAFLDMLKKVYLIGGKDNIFAKDRYFQKALFDIYNRSKGLDEERLLYKIRYGFNRLNIRTDYQTYKKILGSLYNSRLSGKRNHVVVEEKQPELQRVG